MHRGAWQATVPGVTQSWTQMKQFNTHSNIRLTCSSLHGHFMLLCVYTHTHTHMRRVWQPTPIFLPGEFHGQGSLAGYSPWSRKESNMAEQLTHRMCVCVCVCVPKKKEYACFIWEKYGSSVGPLYPWFLISGSIQPLI